MRVNLESSPMGDFGKLDYIDVNGKRRKLYSFSIFIRNSKTMYAEFTTDIFTENIICYCPFTFTHFGN